jgi:hypothetical protein
MERSRTIREANRSPSLKICHPERSRTIREANRPAESKDPYTLIDRRGPWAFDLVGWGAPLPVLFEKGSLIVLREPWCP